MASWTVLHARRIAVVTPSRFRGGARRQRSRGQRRSKMNPRGRYYIRLIPIHSGGQENDVRRHKGLPVCRHGEWEGRSERAGKRSALRGYRVNAPWMNDEPWGRPYTPSLPPACPRRYFRTFVTPCEFESDFKSVSRALRGIAIRIVVGPDPYYILARTTIPSSPSSSLTADVSRAVMRLTGENENRCANESEVTLAGATSWDFSIFMP